MKKSVIFIVIFGSCLFTCNMINAQVGIGTITPERQLEVHGDWETMRISTDLSGPTLEFVGSATTDWGISAWENLFYIISSSNDFEGRTNQFQFSTSGFFPSANNAKALGADFGRWSNIYTVNANLSGLLNGNNAVLEGTMGVGTYTPARTLEVLGDWRTARISSAENGATLEFVSGGSPDWAIGQYDGAMRIFSSTDDFANSTDVYWFTANEFRPFSHNTRNLGTTSVQWSKLYSVDGFFTGKVGVGTQNPLGKLHVHDMIKENCVVYITPTSGTGDSASIFLAESSDASQGMYWLYDGINDDVSLWGKVGAATYGPHLRVKRNTGEIAFGDTYASGYKLAVKGKLICTEVRVEETSGWPDYVFAENYNLMSLREVEQSILTNRHLPGIPSAAAIQNEGFELGDMSKKLLEKIEELTLYIIEQDKKISGLEQKMAEMENQNLNIRKARR